jgi:cell division protein FtsB
MFQALDAMKASVTRYAYVATFVLLAWYALFALRGTKGVHALAEKQDMIQEGEKRNSDLARKIERQREHIRRLETNPAQQELEVRERLKLAHPNEKIFIIGEPSK